MWQDAPTHHSEAPTQSDGCCCPASHCLCPAPADLLPSASTRQTQAPQLPMHLPPLAAHAFLQVKNQPWLSSEQPTLAVHSGLSKHVNMSGLQMYTALTWLYCSVAQGLHTLRQLPQNSCLQVVELFIPGIAVYPRDAYTTPDCPADCMKASRWGGRGLGGCAVRGPTTCTLGPRALGGARAKWLLIMTRQDWRPDSR